jgi:hypothetical protein
MLDRHPDIVAPPEPWLMIALQQLGKIRFQHPANSMFLSKAISDFLSDDLRVAAMREAARVAYDANLNEKGKTVFLDKTPRYWQCIDFIDTVFPEAKYIFLLRDPLDIAASLKKSWGINVPRLMQSHEMDLYLQDMIVGLDILHAFAETNKSSVLTLRYEDLVRDPAESLLAAIEHLGLSVPRKKLGVMLDFGVRIRDNDKFGDQNILAESRTHNRSVGSWRATFDQSERQSFLDGFGRERFLRLGYQGTFNELLELGTHYSGEDNATRLRTELGQDFDLRLSESNIDAKEIDTIRNVNRKLVEDRDAFFKEKGVLLAEREALLTERAALLTEQEALLTERDALLAERDALLTSTSWRTTQPLRLISSLIKHF